MQQLEESRRSDRARRAPRSAEVAMEVAVALADALRSEAWVNPDALHRQDAERAMRVARLLGERLGHGDG